METTEQFYKTIYIHSEDDLPKEKGRYAVGIKGTILRDLYIKANDFNPNEDITKVKCNYLASSKYWLESFDWYLLPFNFDNSKSKTKETIADEKAQILENFANNLIKNQKDIPSDIQKIVNKYFMDLCGEPTNSFTIPQNKLSHQPAMTDEVCPNCKETIRPCACMRNTCFRCGKPVGNITFTVCDDCKAESSKSKMTKIVKDETGNVYTHICENCGILFYDTNLWCDPNGKILCSNCAKDVKQAKYDIKAETLEKIIAKQTELIINLKTGFVNIIGGQLSCQEITRLETELKSLKKNK